MINYWCTCENILQLVPGIDGKPPCSDCITTQTRFPIDDLPQWIRAHKQYRNWRAAQWLGRARDPEDRKKVAAIYREARVMRKRGLDVVVDHCEPLCSDWVCGLSHSANLRIVYRERNIKKSNHREHPDLFGHQFEPHQWSLL